MDLLRLYDGSNERTLTRGTVVGNRLSPPLWPSPNRERSAEDTIRQSPFSDKIQKGLISHIFGTPSLRRGRRARAKAKDAKAQARRSIEGRRHPATGSSHVPLGDSPRWSVPRTK